jgi:ABC-type nitrate/sulfonate/bicarbonate transport system substrate-binding protein
MRSGLSLVNTAQAGLCCAMMMLGQAAQTADKIVAGTLGGQAPLWPFYIAVHKGFFAAEGIDLELNFAHSGVAVIQQLTAGSLDVALSVGITEPIHAIDKGAPLALIRVVGDAAPYVLMGKPGLKTIADLKGKTVSISRVGDISSVYFERMMAANGLNKGDYDVISAGVAASRYAALRAGVADAAWLLPPLNFHAAATGYITLGLAANYVKDLPFTGMAVLKRWAAAHVPVAKRLLSATDRSIAWFADASHRGEAIDLLVKVAHASTEDAEASYDYLRRIEYFEPSSKVSRTKLRNLIELEKRAGNVDPGLAIDRLVMPGITELTD